MELTITKGKVDFNTSELGNHKECVFVEFPNCISTKSNKSFKWMPTYRQLEEIKKALEQIEKESWQQGKENDTQSQIHKKNR